MMLNSVDETHTTLLTVTYWKLKAYNRVAKRWLWSVHYARNKSYTIVNSFQNRLYIQKYWKI